MRNRILNAVLATMLLVALLLGLPLAYTAYLFVEDTARRDMQERLGRMSEEIIAQEGSDGLVVGGLDTSTVRLLVPDDGRVVVVYPTPENEAARLDIGAGVVMDPLVESLSMGTSGSLRMEIPGERVRTLQHQVLGGVTLLVLLSVVVGALVAVATARRLSDPLREVAGRAARLARGDFRTVPQRYGIVELDRVSDVLDSAAEEIAGRLQREHALVGDVSHQLRSRMTAIRLRLDELSAHRDPAVVEEADAAMAQVDRLTTAIDDLVRQSRASGAELRTEVSVVGELAGVIADWRGRYHDESRDLVLRGDPSLRSSVTAPRLREAAAVLVDNALVHGGGTCTVSVRRVTTRGDATVCVEVADEGEGVSDELAPHIFDRGVSGGGSTGVGLALARALTEADGGRLELQRRRPALFAMFLGTARERVAVLPDGVREPR
ncbi:MAG: HAMP domain-containing histidine kinase [Rhodococcus sp.]|uniref:sensor histidine kinase n=1 Tax=Rhodococcus TaxID=1827 RepID=UPI0016B8ADA4|nr:HAMP domain-containing sensor histidine kinase [Rhodococcus sp. (in: high G+C Gram-positive bacteria)]NLV80908.1 HAMP domain-containing histidine kinase [Rhodococcus sp. (in: high G+C Gram-positive bacteria)]